MRPGQKRSILDYPDYFRSREELRVSYGIRSRQETCINELIDNAAPTSPRG